MKRGRRKLPPNIRQKALYNYRRMLGHSTRRKKDMKYAMHVNYFSWASTREGPSYWWNISIKRKYNPSRNFYNFVVGSYAGYKSGCFKDRLLNR